VTRLYLITDRRLLGPDPVAKARLVRLVSDAAGAGVELIQVREKDLSARELASVVADTVSAAGDRARVLVNDRFDVALAAGAAGVHLTAASLPVAAVRAACGTEMIVGVSTHSRADVMAAAGGEADLAVLGPVLATPSKARFGPPLGLDGFARAVTGVAMPVFALGGMTADAARAARDAGAAGIAGIRLFHQTWLDGGASGLRELVGLATATEESG
jgi:thiamine-phosphate pyrophosphorylase